MQPQSFNIDQQSSQVLKPTPPKALLYWESLCALWIIVVGSLLHFAFEWFGYWEPSAIIFPVNESVWEHLKMYFWPGLLFALFQWRFTRCISNNYWLAKLAALIISPILTTIVFQSFMTYIAKGEFHYSEMSIVVQSYICVFLSQMVSCRIQTMPQFKEKYSMQVLFGYLLLILVFSTLTYYPPKIFIFEHQHHLLTGKYGILEESHAH